MQISHPRIRHLPGKITSPEFKRPHFSLKKSFYGLLNEIKYLGYSNRMDTYELLKLGVFNQLNFFQLLACIFIPVSCFFHYKYFPAWAFIVAFMPAFTSVLVLYLNKIHKHQAALVTYFIFHPLATSFVFMNGMNLGLDLYFVLYGILAVFFLRDIAFMVFTICFAMINFFILSVVLKQFLYQLENINNTLYLINEAVAIIFIFYGLYLIKNENTIYQDKILQKNNSLQKKNIQIQTQADKIKEDATLLEKQTKELTELNALKNKLFGILSHDLKAPMYALRHLFTDIQQQKMSATHLKKMMPEVVNDLNYTVGLMENLLQWVKTQMHSEVVNPQKVDIGKLLDEAVQLVRLQAERKKIKIKTNSAKGIHGIMDKEMIYLVMRNLLSNAIKFTPQKGTISVGVNENDFSVEVYIQDSGNGISPDVLSKIRGNNFYTTKGTANESGTGLGLMLCKEYLNRNRSQLLIESEIGKGSIFSFTLPKTA
ncbi:MAG TPA: HAMP domain-containing sensor histidine kinase [Chitinophagaceae bacterium]|nr:HAMP domain-containing sensor histidine kinase [Chitinophagaceae bacterium]